MTQLAKRKNIRLENYDYSQNGAYFITICTKDRRNILWSDTVGATFGRPYKTYKLSYIGKIIENEISKVCKIYDNVTVDKYIIMPNHIHMILMLFGDDGRPKVAPTISRIIQQFKGSITKQVKLSIWQKIFHDHIIRDEQEYQKIWEYIDTNHLKWLEDIYYL